MDRLEKTIKTTNQDQHIDMRQPRRITQTVESYPYLAYPSLINVSTRGSDALSGQPTEVAAISGDRQSIRSNKYSKMSQYASADMVKNAGRFGRGNLTARAIFWFATTLARHEGRGRGTTYWTHSKQRSWQPVQVGREKRRRTGPVTELK